MSDSPRYGIGELADLAGISRRAVRFYVQRGLLPPPAGAGRGHYYITEHLDRLRQIKVLQEAGLSLEAIISRFATPIHARPIQSCDENLVTPTLATQTPSRPTSSLWLRLQIADGCELHLRSGTFRLGSPQTQRLQHAIRQLLGLDPRFPENKSQEESSDE
ncbi:MAG: MerR family transcriptional regulator [Candidatus Riflebacteria bacterium]|nr:MerR family transcriptional regulator [Candidatus Riflebacteria bacterium]